MMQVSPGDWAFSQISLPAQEPMTLAQAKLQVKVPSTVTEFDTAIAEYIQTARQYLESSFDVVLVKQRQRMTLAHFPAEDRIRIPRWPVQSFDAMSWVDVAGGVHTLALGNAETVPVPDVYTRVSRKPAELILPFSHLWPSATLVTADAVRVDMTLGFLTGDSPELMPIPPAAIQAMKLLIGHAYNNGSAVTIGSLQKSDPLAMGVQSLMANIRLW